MICILFLTCANDKEAEKISKSLLEKRLVFCIKKSSVFSSFLWKGKIDQASEVLLIMDSLEGNFEKVENEVARLHSYETFVLLSTSVSQTTTGVKDWIKNEFTK
ncbi:divalent-cation tolerance protein CutA [Candidatus Roizmanbacteria bacterium]|nr:divalent-cation tolerance protein CutA [Candidatus Roizmanbacteria bacterium]